MFDRKKFDGDLALGRKAENNFASYLVEYYGDKLLNLQWAPDKNFKAWDIKVKILEDGAEKEITYEVKSDTKSMDTGNFVVEYLSWWNPSWINATKADYWVHYVGNWSWWIQKASVLKEALENSNWPKVKWWDDKASWMYKIPCSQLPILFSKVDTDVKGGEYYGEAGWSDNSSSAEVPWEI